MNTSDLLVGMRFDDQSGCHYVIEDVTQDEIRIKWLCKCNEGTRHHTMETVRKGAVRGVWRVWRADRRTPDPLLNPEKFQTQEKPMTKKYKHTVEIETYRDAQEMERVLSEVGTISHKITASEEVKPPLLPLKVGDRLRRKDKASCTYTVIHKCKTADWHWTLECDNSANPHTAVGVWHESEITSNLERIP